MSCAKMATVPLGIDRFIANILVVHAVLEHDDLLKTYFTRYGSNTFKVWWDL